MNYNIGLLFDSLYDEYENIIWKEIIKIAQQKKLNLISFAVGAINSPYEQNVKRNILYKLITPEKIDGIIAFSASIGNYSNLECVTELFKNFSSIPLVSIGAQLKNSTAILVDNNAGMHQILDHLINYHHYKKIVFIKGPDGNVEADARYKVYLQCLRQNGIQIDENLIVQGDFCRLSGSRAISSLLDNKKIKFDAVVCANDYMALDVMIELEKRGIRVPKDVAITGFDDFFESRCTLFPITTVHQPAFEIAGNAISFILERIKQYKAQGAHAEYTGYPDKIVLPAKAVFRRSCGCFIFLSDKNKIPPEFLHTTAHISSIIKKNGIKKTGKTIREKIIEEMDYNFPESISLEIKNNWTEQIIRTLETSINENENKLLYVLEEILIDSYNRYLNPLSWYPVITFLFNLMENTYRNNEMFSQMWKDALMVIGSVSEHAQANIRIQKKIQGYYLHLIEEAFRNIFDVEKQKKLLNRHLPEMKIHNFYLGLYPTKEDTDHVTVTTSFKEDECRPINKDKISIHAFLSNCLVPGNSPGTYVVFPIHSDNQQLGIVIIQIGEISGAIYETLATQLNSTIHEAAMFNLQQEYAHDLENQVKERTKELECINIELAKKNMELAASNKSILILNKELEFKNKLDGLTRLYNRTAIYDVLENGFRNIDKNYWRDDSTESNTRRISDNSPDFAIEKSISKKLSHFSIIIIDIDHFKRINDTYGHLFGDKVLVSLSRLMQDSGLLRKIDIIGRFGGEEFLIVLPFTEPKDAKIVGERIREKLDKTEITYDNEIKIKITLSMGISKYYINDETIESVISRADMALYYAKAHGRDQIISFSDVFKK